jgi:hypothetical protein
MYSFIWGVIATICCAAAAVAHEVPISTPSGQCFNQLEYAAVSALDAAESLSKSIEYAGAVYTDKSTYCYTNPVTNGSPYHFQVRIAVPKGSKIVALYHAHPAGRDSEFFSREDVETAKSMHLVSFIRVIETNRTLVFDPNCDPEYVRNGSMRANGRIVRG